MTLNHLLSAVRELLLDEETKAEAIDNRRAEIAKRFPQLEKTEVDDLATIAPERMRVYTELIYNGEVSMLRWVYPVTFAVLSRLMKIEDDANARRTFFFDLIRKLHRFRAWGSDSSRLLAANFQDFFIETKPDLQKSWPGLLDIIDYEKTSVDVFYALDVPHRAMAVTQLSTLSVGELLDLPVFVPACVAMRKFQHDVMQLGAQWRDEDKLPDHLPSRSENLAVCGRDVQSLMPKWLTMDGAAYDTICHVSSAGYMTLNGVAAIYLQKQSWPDEQTEEIQFRRFFQELVTWFSAGVICVKNS